MKTTGQNANELGLNVLSMYKKAIGNEVQFDKMITGRLDMLDHSTWSELLKESVTPDGNVDYANLSNNKIRLNKYCNYLSQNPPSSTWKQNEKLAYWINAYNAFTVKLIVDHYPIKSIKDISNGLPMINSPWDIKFFKIGGVDFDLNTIEHEILRKQFQEPRIHFAINCASISCPKLRNEAFSADLLEDQLENQTLEFISDRSKNQIGEAEMKLSSIFNWFEGDFTKEGSLESLILKYKPDANFDLPISYLEYDWRLNQ